ncbi:MAG: hypothetical protein OXC44_02160 [Proteobacteria bacterium]|nr:hypothetical protein [Pseudomonadota bacterium]
MNSYSSVVIGAGAIGHVIAARFRYLNIPVTLLTRHPKDHPSLIEAFDTEVSLSSSAVSTFGSSDYEDQNCMYWLTAPVYQLQGILADLLPRLPDNTVVVVMANGAYIPILSSFQSQFGHLVLRPGVVPFHSSPTSSSSYKASADPFVIWGETQREVFWLGGKKADPPTLREAFLFQAEASHHKPFFRYSTSLDRIYMKKWLMNTTMNSISGAYGLTDYNPFFATDNQPHTLHLQKMLKDVFAEAYELGKELWGHWEDDKEDIFQLMTKTIAVFRNGENSLHRHLRTKKLTENDFLAGLVQQSQRPQDYPLLHRLYHTIKDKERSLGCTA